MIEMTLQEAESFVQACPEAEWSGWDLELFIRDNSAQYSPKGVQRGDNWYRRQVIAVNEKGKYVISNNYERFFAQNRD